MSDSDATDAEPDDGFRGPTQIGYAKFRGRGTAYSADYDGHMVEVFITEKAKRVRIHVDGQEWKPVKPTINEGATSA